MSGPRDFFQSMSNSVASNVSAPVDGLAWLLKKAGVPVGTPVGGSDWMAEKGLTRPVKQGAYQVAGETAGLLSPMAFSKSGLQAMIDAVKATKNMPVGMSVKGVDDAYRMSHAAPGPEYGAPLHDLTGGGQMYPADVYSPKGAQYYGTGYPAFDKEAFAIANKVKGNPDAEVVLYRAVPKGVKDINPGDWVTLSKGYAKNHGDSVLEKNYDVLSKKVKASELYTNADSIHEFGYHPGKGLLE